MLIKLEDALAENEGERLEALLMQEEIIDIVNGLYFKKGSDDKVSYIIDVDDVSNDNIECHSALTMSLLELKFSFRTFTTNE